MLSGFLQFGYIGLLALMITLCYQIIQSERSRNNSIVQTLVITGAFSIITLIGGISGYFWSAKELEITQTQLSAIQAKNSQIELARKRHLDSTEALRAALKGALNSFEESVLESTRAEKLSEAERINKMLSYREDDFQSELKAIAETFGSE